MTNIVLMVLICAIIGWAVHKIMGVGNHETGLLHYAFVGGTGWGLGALLEWATRHYASTLWGTLVLWIACSCVVEYAIRCLKRWLMEQDHNHITQ